MSCLAGAIRRYLSNEQQTNDNENENGNENENENENDNDCQAIQKSTNEAQQPADLPIAMTYNTRSISDIAKSVRSLSNSSGAVLFNLPVSIADPLQRLDVTKKKIVQLKNLLYPRIMTTIYNQIIGILPGFLG